MNTQETIIQLKELKLKGMADTLESLMGLPVQNRPSFDFAAYSGAYPFNIPGL